MPGISDGLAPLPALPELNANFAVRYRLAGVAVNSQVSQDLNATTLGVWTVRASQVVQQVLFSYSDPQTVYASQVVQQVLRSVANQGPPETGQWNQYDWPVPAANWRRKLGSHMAAIRAQAEAWRNYRVTGIYIDVVTPGATNGSDHVKDHTAKPGQAKRQAFFTALNVTRDSRPNPTNTTLKGQDLFFRDAGDGPNYDWPNPVGWHGIKRGFWVAALRAEPDVAGAVRLLNLLKSKDQVYGAPGQVPEYDWPNPLIARRLLPVAAPIPFTILTIKSATAAGDTITAAASIIAGAATGKAAADGATISAAASIVSGTATGKAVTSAATATAAASIVSGAATGQATGSGATISAAASLAASGTATGTALTSTATATAAASLAASGAATGKAATAAGAASATTDLIAGGATGARARRLVRHGLPEPLRRRLDGEAEPRPLLPISVLFVPGFARGSSRAGAQIIVDRRPKHGAALGSLIDIRAGFRGGPTYGQTSYDPALIDRDLLAIADL